jgi:hypothetical protein
MPQNLLSRADHLIRSIRYVMQSFNEENILYKGGKGKGIAHNS